MKRFKLLLLFLLSFHAITAQGAKFDEIRMSIFESKKIVLDKFNDPAAPNITCYISRIKDRDFFEPANPSDTSISCTKTSPTELSTYQALGNAPKAEIYVKSQSIGDKSLRVKRIYDPSNFSLVYVGYTNQTGKGSTKHAIAVVNLDH